MKPSNDNRLFVPGVEVSVGVRDGETVYLVDLVFDDGTCIVWDGSSYSEALLEAAELSRDGAGPVRDLTLEGSA